MSRPRLQPENIFELEVPSAPAVARSGLVAYLRRRYDRDEDRILRELWCVETDGRNHRRLAPGERDIPSFAWGPAGSRLAYAARSDPTDDADSRHRLMQLDALSGNASCICELPHEPRLITWSPDGRKLAFVMAVRRPDRELVPRPSGDNNRWAPRARYIDDPFYRLEGVGLIEHTDQLFVVDMPAGQPQMLPGAELRGGGLLPFGIAWRPDSSELLFASNLDADWQRRQCHADVYAIDPASGRLTRLTREPVSACPVASPDGQWIAFLGFEDRSLFHHQPKLWLMRADGSDARVLLDIDRDLFTPAWDAQSRGVYFSYFDAGVDKVGFVDLAGQWRDVAHPIGGTATPNINIFGSEISVGPDFVVATTSAADRPPQVALARDGTLQPLTDLNADWNQRHGTTRVREVRYRSSLDGEPMQGWLVYPPDFDPRRRYPLIVEIHGGPNAAYGPKFSFTFQCWAAAGFVVFYPNYRGSTSYGSRFVNFIQQGHPQHEHEDILAGVAAVETLGGIDSSRLFLLGASAGGTLTAWTLGKSDRFRAAVCMHPCINYSSFALSWDLSSLYARRWLPRPVWEDPAAAWAHSPLSLVRNIRTPTLVVVGDRDQRTPPGEGEQLYNALQQRGVETALLIRHGVGHAPSRPSQDIELNLHILRWFAR